MVLENAVRYHANTAADVLILLLVEYGLGAVAPFCSWFPAFGLNPSFSGIWSWSKIAAYYNVIDEWS